MEWVFIVACLLLGVALARVGIAVRRRMATPEEIANGSAWWLKR